MKMIVNNELAHFGVLGMRWGHHKRKESPRVTSARATITQRKQNLKEAQKAYNRDSSKKVMKRLSDATREYEYAKQDLSSAKILNRLKNKNKSKTQLSLETKYKKDGMSDDEAAVAAYKNIRTRKVLAVAGTAAVAYGAYKIYDHRVDKIIKSGTLLQNISSDSTKGIRDAFYSSGNKLDNMKYQGLYGKQLSSPGDSPGAFRKQIKVLSDIRQASHKNAHETLTELMKKDPEFAKGFEDYVKRDKLRLGFNYVRKGTQAEVSLAKGKVDKNVYELFNASLVDHTPEMQTLTDKYYSALSKKGYNAIKDINDSKYSGYKALNPIIAFNTKGKVDVIDVKQLAEKEIDKAKAIGYAHIVGSDLVKLGAQITGGVLGWKGAEKAIEKKIDTKVVAQYRKKHPESKLTNTEITRMEERERSKRNNGY